MLSIITVATFHPENRLPKAQNEEKEKKLVQVNPNRFVSIPSND